MRAFLVTPLQARKLPRWALLLLCVLYVLPGLIGRDPWRTDDAAGFGIALSMARGGFTDWLIPNIAGLWAVDEGGPLPFALSALLARALAPVAPLHVSIMLATAVSLTLSLVAFWYGSYALSSRPGLQPPDPLGAGASRTDFGRAIADSGLLVLLACIGLITRMHETTAAAAQVTLVAIFLFGVAWSLECPRRGAALAGLAIAASVATRGLAPALALLLAWLVLPLLCQPFRLVRRTTLTTGLPAAVLGGAAWPLLLALAGPTAREFLGQWLQWNLQSSSWTPQAESLLYIARTAPWFYWPVWPLALWAIWRWRGKLDLPALALPLVSLACLAIPVSLASRATEADLLLLVPPLAMLAAISLPTLRRAIVSLIDWFAVMLYTVLGIGVWAYWIAFTTGYPPRMAYRASMLAPEFVPDWILPALALGVIATVGWLLLVRWRVSRQRPVLWRAVALSAGGLVFTWFLLMTLWLPAFNARNTYRDIGQAIGAQLAGTESACISTRGLGRAERASIAYFAGPVPLDPPGQSCGWLLIEDHGPIAFADPAPLPGAALAWSGKRRERIDERFRLYRREPGR